MMQVELSVKNMLTKSITSFKQEDFDSSVEFESVIIYLKRLEESGYIELLDVRKETSTGHRRISIVLWKEWLSNNHD